MRVTLAFLLLISALFMCSCDNKTKDDVNDSEISQHNTQERKKGINLSEFDYEPIDGDIVILGVLFRDDLRVFFQEPTMETLLSESTHFIVYRKSNTFDNDIESYRYAPTELQSTAPSGTFRIGGWPVYSGFIDFMNDDRKFTEILFENDISEEMIFRQIIVHNSILSNTEQLSTQDMYYDMCIWIHTENGDYFLHDNPYLTDNNLDTSFTYDFYDLNSYIIKLGFIM